MKKSASKVCEYCGKTFYHYETQQHINSFQKRRFCSVSCASKAAAKKRKENGIVTPKDRSWVRPKICPQCGEEFLPNDYECRAMFKKRKFCSHKCAYESRKDRNIYVKTCLVCGATYEKRKNESTTDFCERKYCSHECANASRDKRPKVVNKLNGYKKPHSFAIYVNNM